MGEPNTVTVSDRPPSNVDAPSRPPSHTGSSSTGLQLPLPETVLLRAEIEQSRRTAIAGLVFNTMGLVVVPMLGGDPTAKVFCLFALLAAELNNAWLLLISTNERRYSEGRLLVYFAMQKQIIRGFAGGLKG